MDRTARVVRFVFGKPGIAIALVCLAVVLAAECASFLRRNRVTTHPIPAPQTEKVASWERAPVVNPPTVALNPPPKERRKLERKFEIPLPADKVDILAVREIPAMPTGGSLIVTTPPGSGEVEVTLRANRAKFFELTGVYGIGGLAGVDHDGQRWRGYAYAEPVRIGRFHARIEAGVEGRSTGSNPYILAGAEWRSE